MFIYLQSLKLNLKEQIMKLRVAKKIVKNQENLDYNKGQVKKAENKVSRYKRASK